MYVLRVHVRVCVCVVVVRMCVCAYVCLCVSETQRQEKPWWSIDTDVQIVRYTWRRGRKTNRNHLTGGSLQRFPPDNWSLTASSGKANDQRNREHVVSRSILKH